MEMKALYTVAEVAELSGLGESRIRSMIAKGALAADRSGKPWLVDETEVRRVFARPEPPAPGPLPALNVALDPALVDDLAEAVLRRLAGLVLQVVSAAGTSPR